MWWELTLGLRDVWSLEIWTEPTDALVRVHKIGGKLAFALHVNDTPQSDGVANVLHHMCSFLCHLTAKKKEIEWRFNFWLFFSTFFSWSHTWILSNTPVLSILLATLTVLPQMSYWGLWAPITPAITGPWFIPVKINIEMPFSSGNTQHMHSRLCWENHLNII